jgi:hypothetical protein
MGKHDVFLTVVAMQYIGDEEEERSVSMRQKNKYGTCRSEIVQEYFALWG